MSRIRRGFHRLGLVAVALCLAASVIAAGLSIGTWLYGTGTVNVGGPELLYISKSDTLQDVLARAQKTDADLSRSESIFDRINRPDQGSLVDRINKHGNVMADAEASRLDKAFVQIAIAAAFLALAGAAYLVFWTIGWIVSGFID